MIRKTILYRASKLTSILGIGYGFLLESEAACAIIIFSIFGFVCASEYIISMIERRRYRIVKRKNHPLE